MFKYYRVFHEENQKLVCMNIVKIFLNEKRDFVKLVWDIQEIVPEFHDIRDIFLNQTQSRTR